MGVYKNITPDMVNKAINRHQSGEAMPKIANSMKLSNQGLSTRVGQAGYNIKKKRFCLPGENVLRKPQQTQHSYEYPEDRFADTYNRILYSQRLSYT